MKRSRSGLSVAAIQNSSGFQEPCAWTKVTWNNFNLGIGKLNSMARMQSYKLTGFAEKNISNKNNFIENL